MYKYFEDQIKTVAHGLSARISNGDHALHKLLHTNPIDEQLAKAKASIKDKEQYHLAWIPSKVPTLREKALFNCTIYEQFLFRTIARRYHHMCKILKDKNIMAEYAFPDYVHVLDAEPGASLNSYNQVVAAIDAVIERNPKANNEAKRVAAASHMAELLGKIFDRINVQVTKARDYIVRLYKADQFTPKTQQAWAKFLADTARTFNKEELLTTFNADMEGDLENEGDQQEPFTSVNNQFRNLHNWLNKTADTTFAELMVYQFIFIVKPHGF